MGSLPGNWEDIRNRWEFYHGLRTALTLIGAGSLFASALWSHHDDRQRHRERAPLAA
jgi:hypothetical protein